MASNAGLKALWKAKENLEEQLEVISAEAAATKADYDNCIERAKSLRMQINALEYSINAMGGITHTEEHPNDEGLVTVLEQILVGPPQTFSELKAAVESRGFSPHGVRKALNGIAFTTVKGKGAAKYTLRASVYRDLEKEIGS